MRQVSADRKEKKDGFSRGWERGGVRGLGCWMALLFAACFLFSAPCARAEERVGGPPLEVKVGQMLMVGFRGAVLEPDTPILTDIRQRHLGGVILFDVDLADRSAVRNILSPAQVRRLIADLQQAAEIPLLVAVDQEGGRVSRLKPERRFPATVAAAELGAGPVSRTAQEAAQMAETLAALGFNVNFAPVVDLNLREDNPVIGALGRSFSSDPDRVARHAAAFIRAHRERGILCVLKHFPGHGSATSDSHLGLPDVTEAWRLIELEPFARLAREGLADAVMTAHIFNARLDPQRPATLSKPVVTGILRREIGFDGVVFSDDLQMQAITDHYGFEAAVTGAVEAGVDILVFGNNLVYDPQLARRATELILRLVAEGKIDEERIDRSWRRIAALKARLSPPASPTPAERSPTD